MEIHKDIQYNYKRFFVLLWRNLKREVTDLWNNDLKPYLTEVWNDKIPYGIWMVTSRFGFAIFYKI